MDIPAKQETAKTGMQVGAQLPAPNNPPAASYLPEVLNVVNAVESILPPDVAKKVEDIKNQALALIDSIRENVALNHKKIEFAENHLKQFCHWIHKAHDGKP